MFRFLSIKTKLMGLILAVAGICVSLVSLAYILLDVREYKAALVHDHTILAKVMAANCQASLYFEDRAAAEETLSALLANEDVEAARIFSVDREIFAQFQRDPGKKAGQLSPAPPRPTGAYFGERKLQLFEPIVLNGSEIGTVSILVDLSGYYGHLQQDVAIGLATIALSALFALFLASLFQKIISAPIFHLLETTRAVTRGEGDYSVRARKFSEDELGRLTDGMNAMLAEIEHRDRELVLHQHQLENKVRERTAALQESNGQLLEAKEKAEESTRIKSEFLANMSHELRTPLNIILGYSEFMARDENLSPEQVGNLATIGRSGEHLLALINNVLEFSKIEAGRDALQSINFDLHHLLAEIARMFQMRVEHKSLSLIIDRAPEVPQFFRADPQKLRQVLINLVGNAVKFTQEGGVSLRVKQVGEGCTPDGMGGEECTLQFEIEDTGPGIPAGEISRVFEVFSQASSGQHSRQGSGLGIPISQRFVRMMGGDLTVNSVPGRGSVFCFTIRGACADCSDGARIESEKRVVGLAPGQGLFRILVIEDTVESRKLLVKLLEKVGFEVRSAMNGREGVAIWRDWQPHLIWMDMRMPVMDGFAATRLIKAETRRHRSEPMPGPEGKVETRIIALTASAFEEDRKKVLDCGCDDFLRKPFKERELFDLLAKHLGVEFRLAERPDRQLRETAMHDEPQLNSALLALPSGLQEELRRAIDAIDIDCAIATVEKIRPHHPPLADALGGLLNAYRFDKIQKLFKG